jgi:methanogenic corrinoid protein MtbC1
MTCSRIGSWALSYHMAGTRNFLLQVGLRELGKVRRMLQQKGLRTKVKVMVGGAPVDEALARKIGADGYGKDAGEAVRQARNFVGDGLPH